MDFFTQLSNTPLLFIATAVMVGLCVGSFLNVVIFRFPKMLEREWKTQCLEYLGDTVPRSPPATEKRPAYNLVVPRSTCPACGHKITALENIPLLSYAFLRGRCSACKAPISVRYPLIEAMTAVMSGYIAWRFGIDPKRADPFFACRFIGHRHHDRHIGMFTAGDKLLHAIQYVFIALTLCCCAQIGSVTASMGFC